MHGRLWRALTTGPSTAWFRNTCATELPFQPHAPRLGSRVCEVQVSPFTAMPIVLNRPWSQNAQRSSWEAPSPGAGTSSAGRGHRRLRPSRPCAPLWRHQTPALGCPPSATAQGAVWWACSLGFGVEWSKGGKGWLRVSARSAAAGRTPVPGHPQPAPGLLWSAQPLPLGCPPLPPACACSGSVDSQLREDTLPQVQGMATCRLAVPPDEVLPLALLCTFLLGPRPPGPRRGKAPKARMLLTLLGPTGRNAGCRKCFTVSTQGILKRYSKGL